MDDPTKLHPADQAHLKFLRRQVDRLEELRFTSEAPSGLNCQLFQAREELKQFVAQKRTQGYLI